MARSAMRAGVAVAESLSLAGFGSTGALDCRVAVLVAAPAAVTRTSIASVSLAVTGSAPTVQTPVPASYVPCDADARTNDTLAGNRSRIAALVAGLGPRLVM